MIPTNTEVRHHFALTPELSVRLGFHPLRVKFSETHSYDEATGQKMAAQYVAITCIIADITEYLFLNGRPRRILSSWESDINSYVAKLQPFLPPYYSIVNFLTAEQQTQLTNAHVKSSVAHGAE